MFNFFDEEQFRAVLEAAKECRMKQLEAEFAASAEYLETTEVKEKLISQMEDLIPGSVKLLLGRYDDVGASQLCSAQEFSYVYGFVDCLGFFRRLLGEALEGKQ